MINLRKLKKMVQKDGKIEAQCPACAAAGADAKGNHFVVFPDGKFGCVANQDDKEHNKLILKLVGERGSSPPPQLQIRRETIADSKVLMKIGRVGRQHPTPSDSGEDPASARNPAGPGKPRPNGPDMESPRPDLTYDDPNEITTEDARRFLDEP